MPTPRDFLNAVSRRKANKLLAQAHPNYPKDSEFDHPDLQIDFNFAAQRITADRAMRIVLGDVLPFLKGAQFKNIGLRFDTNLVTVLANKRGFQSTDWEHVNDIEWSLYNALTEFFGEGKVSKPKTSAASHDDKPATIEYSIGKQPAAQPV